MIEASFEIAGIDAAKRIINAIPGLVDVGMEDATKTLRSLARGGTPFRPGSGRAKDSWSSVQRTAGGFSFSNAVPYAVVLEEGLYPSVGPRTVATGSGVFSRQAPEGILSPLVDDENVVNRVLNLVADELERGLRSA